MSTCILLPTVSDRFEMIQTFLESLARYRPARDLHLHIHLQDPLGWRDRFTIPEGLADMPVTWQVSPAMLSAYGARVSALKWLEGQGHRFTHFVNVDDDLQLTPDTHWQPAVDKTDEPGVGFVLTNWVRHPNMYAKSKARMREEFVKQHLIYNGGGMAYNEEVAGLVRSLTVQPSQFEDLWPMTAYLHGFQNYRYLGSLAVHRTGSRGGRQTYVAQEPRPPLCEEWIDYRYLPGAKVGQNLSIPMDSDIRPSARIRHREARAARGWL